MNENFAALSKGDQAIYLKIGSNRAHPVVLAAMYKAAVDERLKSLLQKALGVENVPLTHSDFIDVTGLAECPVCHVKKVDLEEYFGGLADPSGTCQSCGQELTLKEGKTCHWVCYACYKKWQEATDPWKCVCGRTKGPDWPTCYVCHQEELEAAKWETECPPHIRR